MIQAAYNKVQSVTNENVDKFFTLLNVKRDPEVERKLKTE